MGATEPTLASFVYGAVPRKPLLNLPAQGLRTRLSISAKKFAHLFILTPTSLRMHLVEDRGDHYVPGLCLRARMRARDRRKEKERVLKARLAARIEGGQA